MKITLSNKTFEDLVEENNFGWKYINSSYKPSKSKKGKVEIELQHFGKYITNQQFVDWCKANGKRPATFNEALQFALDNPNEQKKYPLVTWDAERLCYLSLRSDGGKRRLVVDKNYPGYYWFDYVRFLVVPAPVPAVSSKTLGKSELGLETWPLETLEINGYKYRLIK